MTMPDFKAPQFRSMPACLSAQHFEDGLDLISRLRQRSGVVDHEISSFDFIFICKLGGHATRDFATGSFAVGVPLVRPALNALLGAAGNDYQVIKAFSRSGLHE